MTVEMRERVRGIGPPSNRGDGVRTQDEFWACLEAPNAHGCRLWRRATYKNGYGVLQWGGKTTGAHIVAYRLGVLDGDAIPAELLVCHSCDEFYAPGDITYRRCCNPDHLWLGTHKQNTQDAVRKGRMARGMRQGSWTCPESRPRGEGHKGSKLTDEQVLSLRRVYPPGAKTPLAALAQRYNCSRQTIRNALNGAFYTHLGDSPEPVPTTGGKRRGADHGLAKLVGDNIPDIRDRLARKESLCSIARLYGVSRHSITDIRDGVTWRHVAATSLVENP